MDEQLAEKLRQIGEADQTDAVVRRVIQLWKVEPYLIRVLGGVEYSRGRPSTPEEEAALVDWTLETLVRWKMLEGAMNGLWTITDVAGDPAHPVFGEFKGGGSDDARPG